MLGEICRNAVRLFHPGIDLSVVLFGLFDLTLDLTDRREIFVELAPVGGAQIGLEFPRVLGYEVEDASAVLVLAGAGLGAQSDTITKQALEEGARVEDRRQRLGLTFPG